MSDQTSIPETSSELEAVGSVFVAANVPAAVSMVPEGESVAFRFGGRTGSRIDLIVGYDQLDRLGQLLTDAVRIRDADDPEDCPPTLDGL